MMGGPATLVLLQVGPKAVPPEPGLTSRLEDLGRRLAIAAEAAQHEAKLLAQANTDSLTGLLNRHGFLASLESLIQVPKWGGSFDVAFVDLDGFKEINDAFGHFVGDEILRQFSRRVLAQVQRTSHHVARQGGDEFALLLPADAVVSFSHHLRKALREPFLIEGREIMLAFSMGVASYPSDGTTVADLLRQSDLAMYKAKNMGGSALVHFTPDMDIAITERLSLLQELRHAIATASLHVVYQPRISTNSQRIVSAEALMRWKHPTLGWISPAKFIPLAEESGLIVPFGYWILEETCKQYKAWHASGTGLLQVSVNVSPVQMMAPGFFEKAAQILRAHDIPAGCIELEITEGAMVQNIEETSVRIRELQLAGFHVALDDFGVGYSSLSYLHQIPFDTLKVDQSFVKRLHESQVSFAIATAIVTLAKALGKRIVAEGVELAEHAAALTTLGADELQGYFFGRPMEANAVADMAHAAIRAAGDAS
jgi:diguanylate cyclase (GGDEF)-like protein